MEATTQKSVQKVKSIDGKKLIIRGMVDDIIVVPSKFSYSWKIKMGNASYYFNSKSEHAIEKMFRKGERAAFTVKESGKYLVVDDVFYTF